MALEIAIRLFWRKGYEGTSLTDLTEAIGVNRPSLYAAFGNKEELFRKAFARYAERATLLNDACSRLGAREAVEAFLLGTAEGAVHPEHPGCLLVTGALTGGDESATVRRELCAARNVLVETWRARFERARQARDLPDDADPGALARFVMTVANGMTVAATGGATVDELRAVARLAMRAWPVSPVESSSVFPEREAFVAGCEASADEP